MNGSGAVLKADADSAAKRAIGFVTSSISNGASGTVYLGSGIITGLTGMTPGAVQYLSQTAGAATETPPSGANVILQVVGYAISASVMYFEPEQAVLLAQ